MTDYLMIDSFAPEPYDTRQPFQAAVTPTGDGDFVARLAEANRTAYGDTPALAVDSLKALILDTLDNFSSGRKLGPGPAMQLSVLRGLVKRRG